MFTILSRVERVHLSTFRSMRPVIYIAYPLPFALLRFPGQRYGRTLRVQTRCVWSSLSLYTYLCDELHFPEPPMKAINPNPLWNHACRLEDLATALKQQQLILLSSQPRAGV